MKQLIMLMVVLTCYAQKSSMSHSIGFLYKPINNTSAAPVYETHFKLALKNSLFFYIEYWI